MLNPTNRAINYITAERERQKERWGADHDKRHLPHQWAWLITQELRSLVSPWYPPHTHANFRTCLVRAAAICVAAIEAIDSGEAATPEKIGDYGGHSDWIDVARTLGADNSDSVAGA